MSDFDFISSLPTANLDFQLLPYLSKIVVDDKSLVQKTVKNVRPSSKNYEDSWGYIIQATRYGGFKWYDRYSGALIFFGRKSDDDSTLVIPTFFSDLEYLSYIVNRVQKAFHARVILKNVNTEETISLISNGFRKYSANEAWDKDTKFDDQTFPQLVIDIKKTIEAKGSNFINLRSALRKKSNLIMREYDSSDENEVLKIFLLKDDESKHNIQKVKRSYFVSHKMYLDAEIEKYVFIDKNTNRIIGFTATSNISSSITAFVAALFIPDVKNASVWGMYHTLIKKYNEGFQYANLGGSEFKSTYKFKREKFRPVEEIGKTHLVYGD